VELKPASPLRKGDLGVVGGRKARSGGRRVLDIGECICPISLNFRCEGHSMPPIEKALPHELSQILRHFRVTGKFKFIDSDWGSKHNPTHRSWRFMNQVMTNTFEHDEIVFQVNESMQFFEVNGESWVYCGSRTFPMMELTLRCCKRIQKTCSAPTLSNGVNIFHRTIWTQLDVGKFQGTETRCSHHRSPAF
jgi:hypothetical protein